MYPFKPHGVKKIKTDKTSRLLEIAADQRCAQAAENVQRSSSAVHQARQLLDKSRKILREERQPAKINTPQSSAATVERARELVKQSRELVAEIRQRRG